MLWDIGGVLLDWNPRYLYRKLFSDEDAMEQFLAEICTLEWHAAHDRGVRFEKSCPELAARHPEYATEIMAWGLRSAEMDRGQITGTVEILDELLATGMPCFALTNMEHETYPRRFARFPFMRRFAGTVVSAHEGMAKPDARLYHVAIERFGLDPPATLAIDDSQANLRRPQALVSSRSGSSHRNSCGAELEARGLLPSRERVDRVEQGRASARPKLKRGQLVSGAAVNVALAPRSTNSSSRPSSACTRRRRPPSSTSVTTPGTRASRSRIVTSAPSRGTVRTPKQLDRMRKSRGSLTSPRGPSGPLRHGNEAITGGSPRSCPAGPGSCW